MTDLSDGAHDVPLVVYLDTNHWYAFGRASAGRRDLPTDRELLERLRMLRREGRIVVPLSAVHYSELWENPRDRLTACPQPSASQSRRRCARHVLVA